LRRIRVPPDWRLPYPRHIVGVSFVVVVAVGTLLLTVTASLVGVRLGRRFETGLSEAARSQLLVIQTSLLGLLALLLGFSFAMADQRYDLRVRLTLEEANAIGTSWLRTSAIADDQAGAEMRRLLTEYVDSRLSIVRAKTGAGVRASIAESERIQGELWSRAVHVAKEDPRSVPAGLLLQSLNQMIDLSAMRIGAARNHIPSAVLISLVVVATVAMGCVGVGFGATEDRGLVATLILSALITFVIAAIVDLDQPRAGLIRVSQAALVDVRRALR
jgi:hypothetical protein